MRFRKFTFVVEHRPDYVNAYQLGVQLEHEGKTYRYRRFCDPYISLGKLLQESKQKMIDLIAQERNSYIAAGEVFDERD
jgi:hypothetical protein